MSEFTITELEAAQKAILSTIHKNEKAKVTLSEKQTPCTSQMTMVAKNLRVHYIASSLIAKALEKDFLYNYSKEELEEAMQAIPLFIQRIENVKPKFREGTPQHTLAIRRIKAFHISLALIERELDL
ncbi:hypothetical protein JOC70_000181 [Clostridium pascui]|uniref:hypothetical protein n=1 Tax=Clostridium pascui TaxID=46609 RepID=UPI00195801B4|nr:hypothetical protein [Clostridium pascui]MBM7868712.1 hypothetical protein [Clostridium pascui]